MSRSLRLVSLVTTLALFVLACQPAAPAAPSQAPSGGAATQPQAAEQSAAPPSAPKSAAPVRIGIGVTETVESQNPYADSVQLLYSIWCEVYGCLVGYDVTTGDYAPALAESWKVENPTTWIFKLNKNAKWQDGSPVTATDVIHSYDRIKNDPASKQEAPVAAPISKIEAVDDYTVRITTKEPTSSLLDYFADRFIITSKALFDQYGDNVYKEKPIGSGPYMLKEFMPSQYVVLSKNPSWWGGPVEGPDEIIYKVMREPEVRVTALLNNEIQIAQFIPPHLAERIANNPGTKIVAADSAEIMFLAMQPKPPFDKKEVRQAVAYAIDRDAIIKSILLGQARRLDGPIGPGQYAYDPDLQPKYTYNPEKAKELLAQAGYPNGVDVELSTPVGRYVQDKELSEAMAQQLTAVGIRTKLLTPEWATLWDNVQKGLVPFYYMGRGSVLDPGRPLAQYFETGGTPRVGYSNPQLDELFRKERAAFDPEERKKILRELMSLLTEEAPAHFLWTQQELWGMAENIAYTPRIDARFYAHEVRVK